MALVILCFAWELWLAPLRPGGSLAALKAAPLALPLAGIFAGRRYTYQWSSMLILAYFAEGVMRAWSERGASQWLPPGARLAASATGRALSAAGGPRGRGGGSHSSQAKHRMTSATRHAEDVN